MPPPFEDTQSYFDWAVKREMHPIVESHKEMITYIFIELGET